MAPAALLPCPARPCTGAWRQLGPARTGAAPHQLTKAVFAWTKCTWSNLCAKKQSCSKRMTAPYSLLLKCCSYMRDLTASDTFLICHLRLWMVGVVRPTSKSHFSTLSSLLCQLPRLWGKGKFLIVKPVFACFCLFNLRQKVSVPIQLFWAYHWHGLHFPENCVLLAKLEGISLDLLHMALTVALSVPWHLKNQCKQKGFSVGARWEKAFLARLFFFFFAYRYILEYRLVGKHILIHLPKQLQLHFFYYFF